MPNARVGVLHPGNMGVFVAASAQKAGCQVYWASEGRSASTHERAERFGLVDAGTVAGLCGTCPVIVSVCPPHAALDVAEQVIAGGFTGLYVDVNAISPERAAQIGAALAEAGIAFVDGGIIGGPAWEQGTTQLYLSGDRAGEAAACLGGGSLEAIVIGGEIGRASALKMCYAAWTKGSTALLCAIVAAASQLGVWEELQGQWERDWPGFAEETVNRVTGVSAKAWRFAGEMDEIARTFEAAGLPGGFHAAAAEVYRRMAHLKDAPSRPHLEEVLKALTGVARGEE